MRSNLLLLVAAALMSGCASAPAPSVQGEGRYLIVSLAGSPMTQIDAKDEATCKTMGASMLKRYANMSGHARCDTKPADAQLPYMAISRNSQISVDITSRYRTEEICNRTLTGIASNGGTVIRNCTKTN
jgi:uncharacterized protein YceK